MELFEDAEDLDGNDTNGHFIVRPFDDAAEKADVNYKMSGTNSNANDVLTAALKETLERTGTLDDVRAQLRTMVLRCMNECLPIPTSSETPALPSLPIENILINELIVEYLSFNGYDQTLSMFAAESQTDQGGFVLGESFIRAELGLERPNERGISRRGGFAMLYEIVEVIKGRKRRL